MTLRHMEGFDSYTGATGALQTRGYITAGTDMAIAATGRNGGNALRFTDSSNLTKIIGGTAAHIVAGFATLRSALFNGSALCKFIENGVAIHVSIYPGTDGVLRVYRADGGTLLATASHAMVVGTYYFVEVDLTVHDTTGAVDVWVNGELWASASGVDTKNGGTGYIDAMSFHHANGNNQTSVDDWYILDTAGADNNARLGDCKVEVLHPTGAGATTDWTPSAGSNWQDVDEAATNGDTDYVSSATPGDVDTYAYGNLATGAGVVFAVQHLLSIRKDDAGARTARPLSRVGGTDYPGVTRAVFDTYTYDVQIEEENPDTAAPWTIADVNGAEFGVELVS